MQIKLKSLERRNANLCSSSDSHIKDFQHLLCEKNALQKQLDIIKDCVKSKNKELIELRRYCDYLELKVKDQESDVDTQALVSKDGKSYSANVCRLIYNELVCDVPVKHCGYLLSVFFSELCGKRLTNVPRPSTCAQMAYELSIITTLQLMEYLLDRAKDNNICLSWDATTVEGCHINEIHFTVDRTNCLVLDVRHLPGGKTSDYVTHITSALAEATDLYVRYAGRSHEEIFNAIKSRVTATLTDRAAVNACVTRQLSDEFETQLIQLNCNVHPLDSVARVVKQSLIKVDESHEIKGSCFGSEGTAANLINAISTLRSVERSK